jgi:DNA-directed RNA polymerase beta subunit
MGVILNYGQIPLVKSRYMKYINNEEHPYGENVIVAIGIYGSYNVEDSILFNEGSIKRGMFRTTYYNMYEDREDSSKVGNSTIDSRFANIENENVIGLKPGYDYSYLNDSGLIKENTFLDDKKVIIGKVQTNLSNPNTSLDSSVFPKKGQLGYVDKSFITEGEEGFRIAKVRIREERIPAIGDKFCSRCGQKGTVGLIIPEEDMPYTEEGIRPDIIINPHALPSRMTIGQLVETLMGKVGCEYGAFGDCTAFVNKGTKNKIYGDLLTQIGYHSSGNQLLYNGQTGEQMDSEIFIGPTYYMRLKHMVKDKINYRARGPRTLLTRQTVQGRANDGGLRIGEMERDGIASHGLSHFLQESLLVRGDEYYMAVCNLTGMICIYNTDLNLFMSPMADGPIKFSGNLENGMSIDNITKYGRTFSIVRVPYALKLLIQELQAMNIQIRIITDKNIDQITSMGFNKSIESIEQPVVKKIKKDKKIKLGQIDQQQDKVIEQADKEQPVEQIEEAEQEPEIQPEEAEVEPEIEPVVQQEIALDDDVFPQQDIEEPQDNITNIPLINKNLNKMEDIIEGKPIVSILEGGKYNKHDKYVKEEFEILGDLDEEEGEEDGEEEYENNSKTRNVEFN